MNIRQYWIWNLDNHWLFLSSQRRKDISWFGQSGTYLWVPTSHSQQVLMVNTGELRTARLYKSQQDDLCPIPSIFSDPHMRYYLFFCSKPERTHLSPKLWGKFLDISWKDADNWQVFHSFTQEKQTVSWERPLEYGCRFTEIIFWNSEGSHWQSFQKAAVWKLNHPRQEVSLAISNFRSSPINLFFLSFISPFFIFFFLVRTLKAFEEFFFLEWETGRRIIHGNFVVSDQRSLFWDQN